jgi:uncharacterized protein YktA (UPF0223 family)
MSDRVSITFSLRIEEVPNEAERLLRRARKQLCQLAENVNTSWNLDKDWGNEVVDEIGPVIESIEEIHAALTDAQTIMTGYRGYMERLAAQQAAAEPLEAEVEEVPDANPTLEGLQRQLQTFKDSLALVDGELAGDVPD